MRSKDQGDNGMAALAVPKGKRVVRPVREPDMLSKRGVPYWFAPEWVRDTNGTVGRIKPIKVNQHGVDLYAVSKDGNTTYIQGSIQKEFHDWHEDKQIDSILLGVDEDEILLADWEYK